MRLIYHPDAEAELIDAARYYEGRIATLGVRLIVDADRAVAKILEAPDRWRIIDAGVRIYLMPRFTIAIIRAIFISLLSNIIAAILTTGDIAFPNDLLVLCRSSLILS